MASFFQRVLGHPFVYGHVRPLVVGGIDWSPLHRHRAAGPSADVILDIGCGLLEMPFADGAHAQRRRKAWYFMTVLSPSSTSRTGSGAP
jgi:hypothetical protein